VGYIRQNAWERELRQSVRLVKPDAEISKQGRTSDMRENMSLVSYCELKYSKPNAETVFKIMPSSFPFIIPVHTM
jgi:hypothetical protein